MAIPARLSVVTVGARDIPGLRRFYRSWGWTEVSGSDDEWAAYLVGGVLFALFPLPELAAEADAAMPEPGTWSGVTFACNVDAAAEVDAAFRHAVAAGATPLSEPVDRGWGGRSGYVADPEGNRWEIAWAPSARFDAHGALIGFGSVGDG